MTSVSAVKRKSCSKKAVNEWCWGWFFIAPTIIGLIALNIIPIIQTFVLSFYKSGDFGKGNIFVGFANYTKMFADTQVWGAVANTLLYTLSVVPVTIIISLILAVWLDGKVHGQSVFRTIYFIPMVAAPAAVTMVWKWLYNKQFGLINHVLTSVGLPSQDWINDPNIALVSIAVIGIWSSIGYDMVLLLAGLQEIPKDYYEASDIDGAGPVRKFLTITIPLISPTMFFVTVTAIIQAMQVFDFIYMMIDVTSPAYNSTVSLVYLFYNHSFKYSDKGYGSTIVVLLLIIIMIITAIQLKIEKKWVNYN
ncbi:carbohydrate ABC transporter permease [Caproicibacter fermentans]|uniref:Sugar ABC transporter permease n=1 Tax=Caproicibacter fermentans TaxID=2576756 RepID=A0A7G8T664_9FIRM|nr:sugar ABC transporter permease [Caproicibacter fermentans]QNK39105.1 sugar ABC transporter permease [Caproicibacter fermentans]